MKAGAAKHILLLGLALFGVYGTGLRAPLIYDDVARVLLNPLANGPWPGLKSFFLSSYSPQAEYEPLVELSHWLIYRIAGERALLYRLTSVLLHWLNAALLLLLLRRWLKDNRLAFLAAVLFAFYPPQTEVLAVTSFKKHLFVSFFCLSILNLQTLKPLGAGRILLCWALQALALLGKESALVIPILALAARRAESLPEDDPKESRLLYAGLFGICALFVLLRIFIVPRQYPPPLAGSWAGHLLTSLKCFFWSLSQFPLPWDLCLEHTLTPIGSASQAQALLFLSGAAALGAVLFYLRRKDRIAALGLFWSGLFLIPFINIVPFLNFSLVANRYLYLSSAGFFLFAAKILENKARHAVVWVCPLLLAYGVMDLKTMALFTDPLELWTRTARCAPNNPRSHTALAIALMSKRHYARAEAAYQKAIALNPNFDIPHIGLAQVYARTGRLDQARAVMAAVVEKKPSALSLASLGLFHLQSGRVREALVYLRRAAAMDPANDEIRLNLGLGYLAAGQWDAAQEELSLAAADPVLRAQALKFLGEVHAKKGDDKTAIEFYEASLKINPLQADAALNLAQLYALDGRSGQAAALLDGLIESLDRFLSDSKDGLREQDREIYKDVERQRMELASRRKRITGRRPGR